MKILFYLGGQCLLPKLANMIYSNDIAYPGDVIEVSCDYEYTLFGSNVLTCEQDKNFKESPYPRCIRK